MAIENDGGKGLQLGPNTEAATVDSNIAQALGPDKELWLIQLPIDFEPTEASSWRVKHTPDGAVLAQCELDGAVYNMIEDDAAMALPVYLVPSIDDDNDEAQQAVPVSRRISILRSSEAPKMCFGMDTSLDLHASGEDGGAAPDEAKTKKSKKQSSPDSNERRNSTGKREKEGHKSKKAKKDKTKRKSEEPEDGGSKKKKKKQKE